MKKINGKDKKNQTENTVSLKTKLLICMALTIVIITTIYFGVVFLYRQIFSENKRFNVTKVIVSSNGYWNNRNHDLTQFCAIKLNSDNIWNLSLNKLQKKAMLLPGVENCDVIRVIPDTIEFIISERVPRAQLADYRNILIDSETYVIPKSKAMEHNPQLPIILGLPQRMQLKTNNKVPELDFAMYLIMKTIRDFSEFEIRAIDVKNPDYYTILLRYNGGKTKKVIIPVDKTSVDIKFIALRTAMSQAAIKNVEYKVFDLSFKDRVICK
jgi:cell division septal protein FtsQ